MNNKYRTMDLKLKRLAQNRKKLDAQTHTFFPRIMNKTIITFTQEEENLLRKDLKYNLHQKSKTWINTLAFEAETAVTLLPIQIQDPLRYQIARNIEHLIKQQRYGHLRTPARFSNEMKTIRKIKAKLTANDAIITKVDKGTSVVILYKTDYQTKFQHFIDNNNFHIESTNPTNKFQTEIRKTINSCTLIIPNHKKWKYVNLNPSPPNLRGLPKIHKPDTPIRPVVNWRNAPAYRLANLVSENRNPLARYV
jgi:hypothetical protein